MAGARPPNPRPRWRIDDVLARTDLANLLDEVAQPATYNTRGRRWHCPITDHADRHASVTMHTDRHGHERWRCWSGDDSHRGDAIDLVMRTQHTDRADAIEWLANRARMIPDQPLPPVNRAKPPPRPAIVPLDPAVARYVQTCQRILSDPPGRPVREWLANRGLGREVLRLNQIGADPGRRMLPRTKGLPYGASIAATFPALDPNGKIRYVQTRYLNPDASDRHDKYDNPAGTLGTNPRLSWTIPVGQPQSSTLIVCEGIPDALTAAQAGFQAVAVLGSQTPDQSVAARISTRAQRDNLDIVVVADHDEGGTLWAQRLDRHFVDHDQPITIIKPPTPGHDLNDWALHDPSWHQQIPSTLDRSIDLAPAPELVDSLEPSRSIPESGIELQ